MMSIPTDTVILSVLFRRVKDRACQPVLEERACQPVLEERACQPVLEERACQPVLKSVHASPC